MGGIKTPTYSSWRSMTDRCRRDKRYIMRGITVCEEWKEFENFLSDMGERPEGNYSIERVDNDKGYCPSNCKWATKREQANNRSVNVVLEYKGERHTLAEWARLLGMKKNTISNRYRRGLPIEKVLHKGSLR